MGEAEEPQKIGENVYETKLTAAEAGKYKLYVIAEDKKGEKVKKTSIEVQVASEKNYDNAVIIDDYYFENTTGTYNETTYSDNTKALDLKEWIITTIKNKGYYIARYEASKNGEKAASKVSIGEPATESSTQISNGMLWNWIKQPDAAIAAKATYKYSEGAQYYSDLINSYAWDTAIVFIQAYSSDTDYALQSGHSLNPNIANTGVNNDKRCNIHDMASNEIEWTTATSTLPGGSGPCVSRGGYYASAVNGQKGHYGYGISRSDLALLSFRLVLYLKPVNL